MKHTKWSSGLAMLVVVGMYACPAEAYQPVTHVQISQDALNSSVLDQIPFQYGLGLFTINNDLTLTYNIYPDVTGTLWDYYALVQLGAIYEDNYPGGFVPRSQNHFFNPITGKTLSSLFSTSPDWALEDKGQISLQNNSYADARQYFSQALANAGAATGNYYLGEVFQTLGQVIHHIEDMAQPQHARAEAHCDSILFCYLTGVYHPSVYEKLMADCTLNLVQGCPAIGSYPTVFDQVTAGAGNTFTLPRAFWTNNGAGMADYTNRGFVGARTNFKGTANPITSLLPADPTSLPFPNATGAQLNLVPINDPSLLGSSTALTGAIEFISTPVTDSFTGTQDTNPFTSTYSIFDLDLMNAGAQPVFSLNRFTYFAAANLLLPRAVGYSAGLLNYFFRGKMAVSLPGEGVYGIVDHATQYGSGMNTDPTSITQGFQTIKVALTNVTPDGEAMNGGTLSAILRFRRNLNYLDNLTEEPGSPGIDSLIAVRGSADESIASSQVYDRGLNNITTTPVALTSTPQEFSFSFVNALPLNATDVYLEVVYQGALGAETNAVVTTSVDISEPTYVSVFNSYDYISIGGALYDRNTVNSRPDLLAQIQPQACVNYNASPPVLFPGCFPNNQTLDVYLDAQNTGASSSSLVVLQALPVQSYVRYAVLTDADGESVLKNGSTCNIGGASFTIDPLDNQITIESVNYSTTPIQINVEQDVGDLGPLRGIQGWDALYCVWDGDGSGSVSADPSVMSNLSGNNVYPFPGTTLNFPEVGR